MLRWLRTAQQCNIGSPIIAFIVQHCLDANRSTASEHLDRICLGTALLKLEALKYTSYDKALELGKEVSCSCQNEHLKQLIVLCLNKTRLHSKLSLNKST